MCKSFFRQIGTVYLYYNTTATNWALSESIGPFIGEGILYGRSVGISLDALAVGAPGNNLVASNSGSIYMYDVIADNCEKSSLKSRHDVPSLASLFV